MKTLRRYHPWRHLRDRAVDVRFADLRPHRLGCWDPDTQVIWLDRSLGQVGRRCTLAHELVHAERNDEACGTEWHEEKQERLVDREAARRLISLDALVDALLWTLDDAELADELWVDLDTLRTRRDALSTIERAYIAQRLTAGGRWIT